MEMPLQDYTPISHGGDLPEHRIWYVRCTSQGVLWDRPGRIDRLFEGSGNHDAPVSAETLAHVDQAKVNMQRLEQEKQERRALKEKGKARIARKRAARAACLNQATAVATDVDASSDRFQWKPSSSYKYLSLSDSWTGSCVSTLPSTNAIGQAAENLTVVTWNVLFDVYDTGEREVEVFARWRRLIDELSDTTADVIALQEVTPKFLLLLTKQTWIQEHYTTTAACPLDSDTVAPSGNLLLWRSDVFDHVSTHVCVDGGRKRAVISVLQQSNKGLDAAPSFFLVANVHLPSNKGDENRSVARRRELCAVLGQLQRLKQQVTNAALLVLGDFNDGEADLISSDFLVDGWPMVSDSAGYTFDPSTNRLAARTRQLTGSTAAQAKRLDRVYIDRGYKLLRGALLGVRAEPPSDHYGLSITFKEHRTECSIPEKELGCSLWAQHAVTTHDTLLGLVLGKDLPRCLQFDNNASSSLPIPHITLLHGFVELCGNMDLIRQVLLEAIGSTCLATGGQSDLVFSSNSISVFDHSLSATLVCCPDTQCSEGRWLKELYQVLRATFPQCHEQESRFAEGWTPHGKLNARWLAL